MDLEQLVLKVFGGVQAQSEAMRKGVEEWYRLYFEDTVREGYDPCQRLPYTIVRKLTSAVFAEFEAEGSVTEQVAREAVAQALIGGECYLKPLQKGWAVVPRPNILILGRDDRGEPLDAVLGEKTRYNGKNYMLLERRFLSGGCLEIENRLFKEGRQVSLGEHPLYAALSPRLIFPSVEGVGLVRVKTPMANCVDGSLEGVSVYAPAVGLIRRVAENEAQLAGEFARGQSRLVVSRDMLRGGQLVDDLFVALDEDPENVGITVFAPQLREQSYLNRQQAYLRAVENLIGLKRGILSQVETVDRTATEITSTEGEYAATIRDFQRMWEDAAGKAEALRAALEGREPEQVHIEWGDGLL